MHDRLSDLPAALDAILDAATVATVVVRSHAC
jgi:hypothetical protein